MEIKTTVFELEDKVSLNQRFDFRFAILVTNAT